MADITSSGPSALEILMMQNRDSDEYSDSGGGGGGGATPIASEGNIFDLLNSSMEGPGSALKIAGLSAANMDFGIGDFKSMLEGSPTLKVFGNIQTQTLFPTIDLLANARNIMMTNPLNAPVPGILKSSQGMSH